MSDSEISSATLVDQARAWRDQDPDAETRAELDDLLDRVPDPDALDALRSRFAARLQFGTAGLRGEIGAGPARMNRVLVGQAARGFAEWLLERDPAASVVIGYDGRTNSRVFALDTAELMAGAGVRAILLPRLLPTPVLAFAVRYLGVSAGVMVTASHNPPRDNGYKVYLGEADEGSQIVSPVDGAIAAKIDAVAAIANVLELPRSSDFEIGSEEILDAYVERTATLDGALAPAGAAPVRFVYTAMHGVGWETASRVFRAAGFSDPISVAEQQEPDAAFPTVSFPNPEEPGALDLAFAAGTAAGADLIVANDPDADRLAIAIPAEDNTWRRLTGNDVGTLLGWRAAERFAARAADTAGTPAAAATAGATASAPGITSRPALAASLVSSPALGAIAERFGLDMVETLTGFKWISRVPGLVFGYEEALGYLVDPAKVRDKDGISAAVDFIALANELAAEGRSIDDHLVAFAEEFGGFASAQVSVRVTLLSEISDAMAHLRREPPTTIGSHTVTRIDDFVTGFGEFGPSDILRLWTDAGARVILRPSGTEPKLKAYIDASSHEGSGADRLAAAQESVADLERGIRELLGA